MNRPHTESSLALRNTLLGIVRVQASEHPFLDDPEEVDPDDLEDEEEDLLDEREPLDPEDLRTSSDDYQDADQVQSRWEAGRGL